MTVSTGIWILIVVIGVLVGLTGGFLGARHYMQNYLKQNPPISEEMLRSMMMQMGQRPSEKKLHQMLNSMKAASKNDNK
ncbi:YneF family protein [Lactiplantibacillus plantarum]|uniref:YneF family protein n=1 Tax=Lactiplantibacillus plantarum TaxID=1590 RepID=UPI001BA97ECF|nr:YneF family protein [Lactiplantibacillus plantarum]MBS0936509.1 YneF family protein [Lactiplantibacillus plantarum]MBS0943307.1 YneF family protein [Lactiplantibacillus plantarum]